MSKDKHRGLSTHRLADNPEERRFADAWQKHNDQGNTLAHLLDPRKGEPFGYPPPVEEPDRVLAATVVQWLGSPVGRMRPPASEARERIVARPALQQFRRGGAWAAGIRCAGWA